MYMYNNIFNASYNRTLNHVLYNTSLNSYTRDKDLLNTPCYITNWETTKLHTILLLFKDI